MGRAKLTIVTARDLPFEELIQTADDLIAAYDAPEFETEPQKMERLSKTIDEMPDVYRWFLTLQSYFDHWTDAANDMHGIKSIEYKMLRQRRDAMERMASAAKRRYDGASRQITIMGLDTEILPKGR